MPAVRLMRRSRERGVAVAYVLLAVALIAVIAAYFAVAGRSGMVSPSSESAKVYAATIIAQGNAIRDAFTMMGGRGTDPATIQFSDAVSVGLFTPDTGGLSRPAAPLAAFASTSTSAGAQWWYHDGFLLPGVGGNSPDKLAYVMNTNGLTVEVCKNLNLSLHGSAAVPATSFSSGDWNGGFSSSLVGGNGGVVRFFVDVAITGWTEGCIMTTDGPLVYFSVYQVQ